MNIELRPVTHTDHPAIHEVYRQCEDPLAPGPVSSSSMDIVIADMQESKSESGVYRGVFYGKKMIGVVSYIPSHFEFRLLDAYILRLMVIPSYRRRGVGGEVLSRVEKEICAHARIRSIISSVQTDDPDTLRFWEKHGYKTSSKPDVRPDKAAVYSLRKEIERGEVKNG